MACSQTSMVDGGVSATRILSLGPRQIGKLFLSTLRTFYDIILMLKLSLSGADLPRKAFGLNASLDDARVFFLPMLGYLEMVGLLGGATCVLTDSIAVQEDAAALGVSCLSIGAASGMPITVEHGFTCTPGTSRDREA